MRKRPVRNKIANVSDAVGSAAETVEDVASGVKTGARHISKRMRNDSHEATSNTRIGNVIVRNRNSFLPDIPARVHVNPLDTNRTVYVQNAEVDMTGASGTLARTAFENYVYTQYYTALTQRVKYDPASLTSANLIAYFSLMSDTLYQYYTVAYLKAAAIENTVQNPHITNFAQAALGPETDIALNLLRNQLQSMWFPPNAHELIKWISGIYPIYRTPNTPLGMFTSASITLTVSSDATLASQLATLYGGFVSTDLDISGLIGKVKPEWRLKIPHYSELKPIQDLDFNWLNVWANCGSNYTTAASNLPLDDLEAALFNDNPNAALTYFATIYDSATSTAWEPGILTPGGTDAASGVSGLCAASTPYVAISRAGSIYPRILRHYVSSTAVVKIDNARAGSISSPISLNDLRPDLISMMRYSHAVDEISEVVSTSANTAKQRGY